ncbi:MAG: hypothetical protein GY938_20860, partial [Ketobacter sp.]|nr:hypothetical protein [Ketobacter sp.]
ATGISTESLSRLGYMAELTGANFDTLVKGFRKLQRSMYDSNEGLETQARAFRQLGVSVSDSGGKLRDTEEVMGDVADAFARMEDGAQKSALATVIFGRAGQDMIPFLNQGRAGLKAMSDEADQLGITMSGKLTKAAEDTNDNLTRLSTAIQGVFLRVISKAMPQILEITKAMVAWAKEPKNVANALGFLNRVMKVVATGALILKGIFLSMGKALGALAAAMVQASQGEFSKAWDTIKAGVEDTRAEVTGAIESVANVWKEVPKQIENKAPETAKKIASPIKKADELIGQSQKDIDKKLSDLKKKLTSAVKEAQSFAKDLNKEFAGRAENLTGPGKKADEKISVIDVSMMQRLAEGALNQGDYDGAVDKARQAFDLLDKMKEAGVESDIVLAGMAKRLQALGEKIGTEKIANIPAQIELDKQAAIAEAATVNALMQQMLDANPLTQQIVVNGGGGGAAIAPDSISPTVIPRQDVEPVGHEPLTPINVTIPGGDTIPFYGDSNSIDHV